MGKIHVFGGRTPSPETSDKPPASSRPIVAAVIVAAGSSTRMGQPKTLLSLRGIPVIARTLLAFEAASLVDEIVVVGREEHLLTFYDVARGYDIHKLTLLLPGGTTRQQSVACGVAAVRDATQFLAIHDGARPLVRPSTIDAVIRAAFQYGAAAAGVHVKDTVKITDEQGVITGTPDRRFLWNVQTPQVFERRIYADALARAQAAGEDYTDDCQLVERLGCPVRLYEGEYDNIKLTTPEDVAFAEGLLRHREQDTDL